MNLNLQITKNISKVVQCFPLMYKYTVSSKKVESHTINSPRDKHLALGLNLCRAVSTDGAGGNIRCNGETATESFPKEAATNTPVDH